MKQKMHQQLGGHCMIRTDTLDSSVGTSMKCCRQEVKNSIAHGAAQNIISNPIAHGGRHANYRSSIVIIALPGILAACFMVSCFAA